MLKKILFIALIFLCSSCYFNNLRNFNGKGNLKLKQVKFEDLTSWGEDEQNLATIALVNSCNQFAKMPDNKQIGGALGNVLVEDFRDVCDIAEVIKGMGPKQARNFFENWFVPFKISDGGNDQGLFTGYYIPELKGSKVKTEIYQYPIYAKPADLKNNKPYLTRKEINDGALNDKGLELAFVADKIDLYFMHIQGSGRVILEDGSVLRLNYAGKNNQNYSSIGKYMIENKIIKGDTSYFAIKNWLKNNPDEADKIVNVNQSFIFFKLAQDDDIIGSQGAPLMAYRSIAIDTDILPLGFPMWLNINTPKGAYQKLVVAQDSGSAIKGAIRGDIFFGRGEDAQNLASKMNFRGKYYVLLPTAAVDRMVGR